MFYRSFAQCGALREFDLGLTFFACLTFWADSTITSNLLESHFSMQMCLAGCSANTNGQWVHSVTWIRWKERKNIPKKKSPKNWALYFKEKALSLSLSLPVSLSLSPWVFSLHFIWCEGSEVIYNLINRCRKQGCWVNVLLWVHANGNPMLSRPPLHSVPHGCDRYCGTAVSDKSCFSVCVQTHARSHTRPPSLGSDGARHFVGYQLTQTHTWPGRRQRSVLAQES